MTSYFQTVIAQRRDPDDCRRRIYVLDCGHAVSRRGGSEKRHAVCGYCRHEADEIAELEMQIEAIRAHTTALEAGEYYRAELIRAAIAGEPHGA